MAASNFGPWPADAAAAEQSPLYASRTVLTEAEITGLTAGAELVLDCDVGEGVICVGEGVICAGSGGGAGGSSWLTVSMLLGVTMAFNGIVPSLTTSVNGTAAVVNLTWSPLCCTDSTRRTDLRATTRIDPGSSRAQIGR